MEQLADLPNIGKVLAEKLQAIGVSDYEALAELGSIEAVLKIGHTDRTACYNMLYAIEGAIQGKRWHQIPKEERARLKAQFDRSWKS